MNKTYQDNNESFEVRDLRKKGWFRIDNAFIDDYAEYIKIYGIGVYSVLCRHANANQKTWPSVSTISEKLGISVPMVYRSIKLLELFNIIKKRRLGKTLCNRYWLIDKNQWVPLTEIGIEKLLSDVNSINITDINNVNITSKQRLHHYLTGFTSNSNKTNSKKTNIYKTTEKASPVYFKISETEKKELSKIAAQLIKIFKFNVFTFIATIKNKSGYFPPIDKIIKISNSAIKSKPKNIWAYFTTSLNSEIPKSFAKLREREGEEEKEKDRESMPESIKQILAKAIK